MILKAYKVMNKIKTALAYLPPKAELVGLLMDKCTSLLGWETGKSEKRERITYSGALESSG